MRTYLECVPCFARQALDAVRMATEDTALQARVMRRVLAKVAEFSFELPPPVMGRQVHRIVREETGNPDPYREAKRLFNGLGMELMDEMRPLVESSADAFEASLKLALAANVIDLGAKSGKDLGEAAIRAEMNRALTGPLPACEVDALRHAVAAAQTILYITDNAGEIAFDRLLIEQLPRGTVTVAVRGAPVLNDATAEDAQEIGLADLADIITNGSATPGTVLADCPEEFRERFAGADVVMAKGQGNYETLSDEARPDLFFLLRAKCPVVARDLDCEVGRLVIRSGRGGLSAR